MTTKTKQTPAARAGALWGDVDGLNGKLCGARERFMQERPAMPESDWPAYRDAYNAAMTATSRRMAGGR